MNVSVKSGIALLLRVVLYTIIITLLTSVFVFVFDSCQSYAASGQTIKLSFKGFFIFALAFLPFGLQVTSLFLLCYFIKNPGYKIFPLFVFVLVTLFSWVFLSPLSLKAHDSLLEKNAKLFEKSSLVKKTKSSSFKKSGTNVFYFSDIFRAEKSDGLIIDLSSLEKKSHVFTSEEKNPAVANIEDSITEEVFQSPKASSFIIERLEDFFTLENQMLHSEFFSWLSFACMALAIISLAAFRNMSEWRLMNLIFTILLFMGIVIFNYFAWIENSFLNPVRQKVNGWLHFIPYVKNPFAIFANLILTIIFSVVGIIIDAKGRARLAEENA